MRASTLPHPKPFGYVLRLLLMVLVASAAVVVATRFSINLDLEVFFPPAKTTQERIFLNQLERGTTAQLLFIALDGGRPEVLADASRRLAERLRRSSLFSRVHNGSQDLPESDMDVLFEYRYLLAGDLEQRFATGGLERQLQNRLRGMASPLAALERQFLAADPTGVFLDLIRSAKAFMGTTGPRRDRGVWMSQDDRRALLVVEVTPGMVDVAEQVKAVDSLKRIMDQMQEDTVSAIVTGPPAFIAEARESIRSDVRMLSVMAVILVAALLFFVFWSWLFLVLVMIPLTIGILVAVASVLVVFGSIHGITLAFGVTLTGVAVDYPIHLILQADGGRGRAREHVRRIWPTLRLGVATTVIAYASLIFSDFTGLIQLGLFTVTGLLTAAAVTRWWLPLIVPAQLGAKRGLTGPHNILENIGRRAPRARMWAILAMIVAAAYLVLVDRPIREYDIDSLSPIPIERRLDDQRLRADLGMWSGGKMLVIVAPETEQVLQRSEAVAVQLEHMKAQGVVNQFSMAATFLPSRRTQEARQTVLPAPDELRARFAAAVSATPFKPAVFESFFEDVERSRSRAPLTLELLRATSLGSLISPLLFRFDDQWVAPVLLQGVTDPVRIAGLTGKHGSTETVYIELKSMSNAVMVREMNRILRLLGWGALFIYLVLAVHFRDVRKPVYILVPTIASVLVVTALSVAAGIQMTVFHMVSLLLVVGIGLDYALFFNRLTNSEREWATTFKALWVCCVTTVLVFGMLTFSQLPPLQAVGLTVASGAALCLIFGAIWSTSVPRRRRRKRKTSKLWRGIESPVQGDNTTGVETT